MKAEVSHKHILINNDRAGAPIITEKLLEESRDGVSHQEEFNSPQDVHGSSIRGPQIETDSHCSPKLWAQGTGYHVVGASSCTH